VTNDSSDIPKESPRTILFQFVLFPLGVVAIAVGIFFLFGKLASDEQTIPDYLNEIRSGGSHERWQAAYQLSQLLNAGEAKKYPQLFTKVATLYRDSKHDDPRIRRYLSMVLGNLGDRRATPLLIEALKDPTLQSDVETRIYVLLALGKLRDPNAVPDLIAAASDNERDVRKAAIYALGETGDARAVPVLATAINDETADIRYNAALALARFGDGRAVGVLREMLDRTRLDQVKEMRPDQKEEAMLAAIPAYVRVAGAEGKVTLETLSKSDPSVKVRAAATEALRAPQR